MSQYFENDQQLKDQPTVIHFTLNGHEFHLHSNTGVFSKDKLDTGTKILLGEVLSDTKDPKRTLDLGCGIGPVGIVLKTFWDTELTMIDINEKAVLLSKQNAKENHVDATILCQDGIESGEFDCIVLNPPIRAGKKVIYKLFDDSLQHLAPEGSFYIVMRKQHGAASAISYIEKQGFNVEKLGRDKGFWVFVAKKGIA